MKKKAKLSAVALPSETRMKKWRTVLDRIARNKMVGNENTTRPFTMKEYADMQSFLLEGIRRKQRAGWAGKPAVALTATVVPEDAEGEMTNADLRQSVAVETFLLYLLRQVAKYALVTGVSPHVAEMLERAMFGGES